jgi:2-iminoacetate synthase
MILTAREPATLRNELLQFGVSQIDGGTRIELGGYTEKELKHDLNKGQFLIHDDRSLDEVVDELLDQEMLPSFCTACYRLGRTGEHFMEFSVPGFIKQFCTPNAMLTLSEYLVDYASEQTAKKGWEVIDKNLEQLSEKKQREVRDRIARIRQGERDLYF